MNFSLKLGKFDLSLGAKRSTGASSPIAAWMRGQDWNPGRGSGVLVSPYQQSVWVYTVVSALAQTVSTMPFRISRGDRSGENIVTSGPAVDLFNRPHPYLNRFRFWEFLVTWYCLRGETFIVALDQSGNVLPIQKPPSAVSSLSSSGEERAGVRSRSGSAQVRRLLVLNPDQLRHVVEGFELVGWRFTASPLSSPLPPMDLLPEEVIHDALPNPYLFWRGLSPLSVAMLAAQTDYASAQFMKGLMLNNADTGVIVRTDQQLSAEQREQVMAALRARKTGAGCADHPLLLWGGAEIVQPSLSSADMQFMDNRKMNRQEICAALFRMPQTMVGFTENANRAIAESERLNFIENSVTPLCARLEAALDPVIKSFGPDLVGWFDVESHPILQQARRDRVDTALKLFGLGYPTNAINKALDLGLPHLPWGDKGYLPARLEVAGEIPQKLAPVAETTGAERILNALRRRRVGAAQTKSKT